MFTWQPFFPLFPSQPLHGPFIHSFHIPSTRRTSKNLTMTVTTLLNLLAISCLAVIGSFGPVQVSALSVDSAHLPRRDHHVIAAQKRGNSTKRCKPRSAAPAPSPAAPTSSKKPAPKPSSSKAVAKPSPTPSSGGGNGSRKVGIAWAGSDENDITQFWSSKTK